MPWDERGSLELAGVEIGGGWSGYAAQMGMIRIMAEVASLTETTSITSTAGASPGDQLRQKVGPPSQFQGDSQCGVGHRHHPHQQLHRGVVGQQPKHQRGRQARAAQHPQGQRQL